VTSIGSKLKLKSIHGQLTATRLYSQVLARQFECATTEREKARIAREYDEVMRQAKTLQMVLEMLEREGATAPMSYGDGSLA
jgi:hypothetical protein